MICFYQESPQCFNRFQFFFHAGGIASISGEAVGFITLNGFCDTVIADYFWAKAVILTSPTVATIGMSVTIPFAMITDYFIHDSTPTSIGILGAFLVILGFILVNLPDELVENIKYKVFALLGSNNRTNSDSGHKNTLENTMAVSS